MESITGLFGALMDVWKEMFALAAEVIPKAFFFLLWVACGIIILPCVYISAILFPMWTDWGEKL
jgi:hypothetical protein